MIGTYIYLEDSQVDFIKENSLKKSEFIRKGVDLAIESFKAKHNRLPLQPGETSNED